MTGFLLLGWERKSSSSEVEESDELTVAARVLGRAVNWLILVEFNMTSWPEKLVEQILGRAETGVAMSSWFLALYKKRNNLLLW